MAYRAFFALPVDKFATSAGEPTNAVFGFFSMIANLLRDEEPTHVAVAFDAGRTTFRTEVYEAYKGNRDATPAPFKGQVAVIQRVLETMHIPSLSKPQFEADDILATLSVAGARRRACRCSSAPATATRSSWSTTTSRCCTPSRASPSSRA